MFNFDVEMSETRFTPFSTYWFFYFLESLNNVN